MERSATDESQIAAVAAATTAPAGGEKTRANKTRRLARASGSQITHIHKSQTRHALLLNLSISSHTRQQRRHSPLLSLSSLKAPLTASLSLLSNNNTSALVEHRVPARRRVRRDEQAVEGEAPRRVLGRQEGRTRAHHLRERPRRQALRAGDAQEGRRHAQNEREQPERPVRRAQGLDEVRRQAEILLIPRTSTAARAARAPERRGAAGLAAARARKFAAALRRALLRVLE